VQCSGSGSVSLTGALRLKIVWVCTAEQNEVLHHLSISSGVERRKPGRRGFDSRIENRKVSSMEERQTQALFVTGSNPVLYSTPALGMGTSLGTSPHGTGAIPNRFESVFFNSAVLVVRLWSSLGGGNSSSEGPVRSLPVGPRRSPAQLECVPSRRWVLRDRRPERHICQTPGLTFGGGRGKASGLVQLSTDDHLRLAFGHRPHRRCEHQQWWSYPVKTAMDFSLDRDR
jgi:hypothetical protein